MVIIHVVGGFGNQLYCYALYEKLKSLGREVKLDIGDYLPGAREPEKRKLELPLLDGLEYEICTPKERFLLTDDSRAFFARVRRKLFDRKAKIYRENDRFDARVFELDNVYLDGYWNSEAYIADIIPLLQKKIRFSTERKNGTEAEGASDKDCAQKNRIYAEKLAEEESVFLHIRRSDYLAPSCIDRYRDICTETYYRSALQFVKEQHERENKGKELKIYLFSDDTAYVRDVYGDLQAEVIDWNQGEDSLYDCMLMSKCKYAVCANSTFSMWAARLSERPDKVMIRPLYFDRYQKITPPEVAKEWEGWVLMDAEGKVYARYKSGRKKKEQPSDGHCSGI